MDPRDDDPSTPPDPPGEGTHAEALGRAIKVIRTGLGIGRPELAARAGLSYSYLAEIENGKKQAGSSALHAIAKALGMTPSELLAAAEEWELRLAGDEVGATPIRAVAPAAPLPLLDEEPSWPAGHAPAGRRLGARERALRWFREDTATRVWNRAEIESSRRGAARPRASRAEKDADLEATLDQLRALLRGLSAEDRQRVLDLARRLAAG